MRYCRYSAFRDLHKELYKAHKNLSFPSRRIVGNNQNARFLESRRLGLEQFFQVSISSLDFEPILFRQKISFFVFTKKFYFYWGGPNTPILQEVLNLSPVPPSVWTFLQIDVAKSEETNIPCIAVFNQRSNTHCSSSVINGVKAALFSWSDNEFPGTIDYYSVHINCNWFQIEISSKMNSFIFRTQVFNSHNLCFQKAWSYKMSLYLLLIHTVYLKLELKVDCS